MLKLELNKVIKEIKKAKRIIIQVPEGLKTKAIDLIEELNNKNKKAEFFLMIEPLFGACDLPLNEMQTLNADLIIHFGHNEFMKAKNIVYVPGHYEINKKQLKKAIKILLKKFEKEGIKKIALAGTIQYLPIIKKIKKELEKKHVKCFSGKGKRTQEMQLLGCDAFSIQKFAEKIDAALFIGDGLFHEKSISFSLNKKVFSFNPLTLQLNEAKESKERFLRKRMALIALAREAKTFGIIVSTKKGQMRLANALRLKKLIERKKRKAVILLTNMVLPEYFLGLKIDCFVNTACPRLIDDSFKFNKPLINPIELEIALNEKKFSEKINFNEYF